MVPGTAGPMGHDGPRQRPQPGSGRIQSRNAQIRARPRWPWRPGPGPFGPDRRPECPVEPPPNPPENGMTFEKVWEIWEVSQPMRAAMAPGEETWVTLTEACRVLGVSPSTIRRWGDTGMVRTFVTPGGHRRFSRAGLEALLPDRPTSRPSLVDLGETPGRMARGYRARPRAARATSPGSTSSTTSSASASAATDGASSRRSSRRSTPTIQPAARPSSATPRTHARSTAGSPAGRGSPR